MSDDVDVVMAVATMMVVVRFCKCSSRQQHDDREQEGLFHISIIASVSDGQTILALPSLLPGNAPHLLSYDSQNIQFFHPCRSCFPPVPLPSETLRPRLLDAKFAHDRKPMDNAGDKFQE
jgi:hypothetical protein